MAERTTFLARDVDAVAARMTAGDAPADLGARVLGRIGERRQPAWTWMLKPAAALAAVAVVTMTVQVIRTSRATNTPQSAAAHVTPPVTSTTAAETPARIDPGLSQPRRARTKPSTPRISAVEAAWRERAIPALATIEALSIDGIQPEALSIPQLDVKPLTTAPVNVMPIDGKGLR